MFKPLLAFEHLRHHAREGYSESSPYLLDGLGGLLGEVPEEALQYGPGDELFELGLVHGWAVDPVVAALPRPLLTLEDAYFPHGLEEVDDLCLLLEMDPRI